MVHFVDREQATKTLSLSAATLKRYRLEGEWIEGIHWTRINSRCVRYNLELIQDWFHNRHDPPAHWRAIEVYQSTLLSNQKKSTKKTK